MMLFEIMTGYPNPSAQTVLPPEDKGLSVMVLLTNVEGGLDQYTPFPIGALFPIIRFCTITTLDVSLNIEMPPPSLPAVFPLITLFVMSTALADHKAIPPPY